eukprot:COSAG05_NODE_70_length_22091_cov_108.202164_8_plen_46_part_00
MPEPACPCPCCATNQLRDCWCHQDPQEQLLIQQQQQQEKEEGEKE